MNKKVKLLGGIVLIVILCVIFKIVADNQDKNNPTTSQNTNSLVTKTENKPVDNSNGKIEDNKTNSNSVPTEIPTNEPATELKYEISDTYFTYNENSVGSTEFHCIIEVTNTGTENIYFKDAVFDFEDKDGHLLQTCNYVNIYPAVIKPGEKGYAYNGMADMIIDDDVSFDNGLKLTYNLTLVAAEKEMIEYEVFDTDMKEDKAFKCPKITGRVSNNTDQKANLVYITVLYYNSDGKVIGIDDSYVSEVPVGSKKSFELSSLYLDDNIKFEDIAKYEVKANARYSQF